MSFLYPTAFVGLISLGAIILMYMLKQKQTIEAFSTTMLWEKAVLRTMANKPWQKLRKSLLMLLQLIIAALIVFALAHPFIASGKQSGHFVLIVDASYSMQAVDEAPLRFESARERAAEFINSSAAGSVYTVVCADNSPYIAVNAAENKQQAIAELDKLSPANTETDQDSLKSILNALNQGGDVQFVAFSGKGYEFEGLDIANYSVGQPVENIALTGIAHSVDSDRVVVMVKVKNYGNEPVENTLSLYADGTLFDMKAFELEAFGSMDIFFTNVPYGSVRLSAELRDEDALPVDNYRYDVVKYASTRQAVLFTKGNVFLESALKLIPSIELYKGDLEDINAAEGYYLYIYDGVLPDSLPLDGHAIVFNPPEDMESIPVGESFYVDEFSVNDRSFLSNIDEFEFGIAQSKELIMPENATLILSAYGNAIAYSAEEGGTKKVVFGFDLHETDLPLKKEFPIFIYNLIGYFVPDRVYQGSEINSGDSVWINVYPDADNVNIITPDEKTVTIVPPNPAESFSNTESIGIYTVEQILKEKTIYDEFPVNLKIGESSNLLEGYVDAYQAIQTQQMGSGRRNITNIAIILCIALVMLEWYVLNKGVIKMPDAVRLALLVILILSLFDLSINKATDKTAVVFAVDISDSVKENGRETLQAINDSLKNKKADDIAGLVSFAKEASILRFPDEDVTGFNISSRGDGQFTNIAKGLMAAAPALPEGYNKKIVLVSDGNENMGDAYAAVKQLKSLNIMTDVLPIEPLLGLDAQISRLNVPLRVGKDMNYNIEVVIYSTGANGGLLNIYKNNSLILSSEVQMKSGENRYVFSDVADVGGNIIYRAEIIPDADYIYQNNKAYAYSYVDHVPRVLVVNSNSSAGEIIKILDKASLEYDSIMPQTLPLSLEHLNMYDAVILADINYDDMPEDFSEVLSSYVKNGGGLLATGGENSYALGGYHNTPLEEILPVNMELKSKEELPDQTMLIVMDRSGSMTSGRFGVSKLAMAKESVIRSVDALNDEDYFGVLVFDTVNDWVIEPMKIGGNKDHAVEKIASITEGGGTSIKPAVIEAYEVLKNMDTKLKHIILLTDGQDGERDYAGIIEQMKAAGITMSTVAVGGDSDTLLLENLAKQVEGRYYFTDEFSDLPKIFTKESFLSGKKHMNNEEFYAILGTYSPITENIISLPPFYGYVSATAKSRADVILYALDEEPLLAGWQYGIGRSAAFMSDMDGNWSRDMLLTDEGVMLFNNMVSWVVRREIGMEIYSKARHVSEGCEITLNLPYTAGINGVSALITTPSMEEIETSFVQTTPGEYRAIIDSNEEGTYIAAIALDKDSGIEYSMNGINLAFSAEYDLRQREFGQNLLKQLATAGGGKVLSIEDDIFDFLLNKNIVKTLIKPWIILIALLFLLFDIAYHRFPALAEKLNMHKLFLRLKKDKKNVESIIGTEKITVNEKVERKIEVSENIGEDSGNKPASTSARLVTSKKKRSGR